MLDAMLIYEPVVGTFKDPIRVKSAGEEIQCGCTGCPADSHVVRWVVVSLEFLYPPPMTTIHAFRWKPVLGRSDGFYTALSQSPVRAMRRMWKRLQDGICRSTR